MYLVSFSLSCSRSLLSLKPLLNSSSTPEGLIRCFFKLLIVSAGNLIELGHSHHSWETGFWLWTPVSWSIFWSNSSSETPQGAQLNLAQQYGAGADCLPYNSAKQPMNTPFHLSAGQLIPGAHGVFIGGPYSFKGKQYWTHVLCATSKCNYRCCKTSEISCLKSPGITKTLSNWGFCLFLCTFWKRPPLKH